MAIARVLVIALVTYGAMFSSFTPTRGRRAHVAARPLVGIPGAIVVVIVLGAVIGVAELAVSRFKRRE